ncbi:hypothetical protein NLU13_2581 [Sarocladium strictum]|uniref:Flavin reductase like domain-containing protein n=1 Tax=Sarocladium strictum TaxID=5046 RepID=A0AA39GM84_SARSR|nr:hypothetical protein NLU13_2581 [Sarocladium strictum]
MAPNLHNPHRDFKSVEATRPDFDSSSQFHVTKVPSPSWAFGSGPNDQHPKNPKSHVAIDPHEEGRPVGYNYKLLISSIIPRPIAFVSTVSKDGRTQNLAPFSYFNFVNHDPPILVVGFATGIANAKDTLKNVLESETAVINIISETFLEAANATSINAPYGVSEWEVAGLTPVYDCETVKAPRVKEAVFSVEVKVDSVREFDSRATPGKKAGTMITFEGTRFWVREDALNEEKNIVDPAVLRPISRLGGITYARVTEGMELPRPDFDKDLGGQEAYDKLKKSE